jgi:ferredoxin
MVRSPHLNLAWEACAGESVLESAERAGVALVSSCRNGTCRTCMCRTSAGQVRYRVEWPGLSREEKAEGWILPCVAEPLQDLTLVAPRLERL